MVNQVVDPVKTTLTRGTIPERLTLVAGVVVFLYGLVELSTLVTATQAALDGGDPILAPSLGAFFGITIGLVVVVLAVALDFE